MMVSLSKSLGVCDAFLPTGRCEGSLMVVGQTGGIVEAQCDRCGDTAGIPVGKLRGHQPEEDDGTEDGRWWNR